MKMKMLIACALAVSSAGCARASQDECEKAFDKLVDLELEGQPAEIAQMTRDVMAGTKADFVKECDGKASKSEVQCYMDAKDKPAFEKCH